MTKENKPQEKITKHQFYFETPLYDAVPVKNLEENFFNGDVDGYSNTLQDNTTYSIRFNWIDIIDEKWRQYSDDLKKGFAEITLTCKRKENNILRFFVWYDEIDSDAVLMKVGQYPSVADLEFQKIQKKYEKVLDKKYLKEFKRAIGLFAHGVGVGSFVYLRRIFEDLIQKTFNENKSNLSVGDKDFKAKGINEKVEILQDFLPSQLIEMKMIYGILSQGVHKLDDEACLKYFPILKLAIELILDQKIEEDMKRRRDKEVKKQLSKINSELSS